MLLLSNSRWSRNRTEKISISPVHPKQTENFPHYHYWNDILSSSRTDACMKIIPKVYFFDLDGPDFG